MAKKALLILLVFVSLALFFPLFFPKTYHVERSVVIDASPDSVYPYIQDFREWSKWSSWAESDPDQKVEVTGEPGKPGHSQAWDGPKNGKGTMTIDSASPNAFVSMELNFEVPQPMKATSKLELEAIGNGTKVIWHNEGDLDYPIGRYVGIFLDGMIGQDFEKGLAKLKASVEGKK